MHKLNPNNIFLYNSVSAINYIVSNHFEITTEAMLSKSREQLIVDARRLALFLVRKYLRFTTSHIGNMYDMNHTNVLYHLKKFNHIVETDKIYQNKVTPLL
jgi:chromosomal replication initiation ATPase DnaA